MLVFYSFMRSGQGQCFLPRAVLPERLDAVQAALWLSPKLHVTPGNLTLTILLLSLMLYDPLMQHMWGPGGAIFNPANSIAFGAAGTGPGPFSHHLLRSVRSLCCTAGLAAGRTLQEWSIAAKHLYRSCTDCLIMCKCTRQLAGCHEQCVCAYQDVHVLSPLKTGLYFFTQPCIWYLQTVAFPASPARCWEPLLTLVCCVQASQASGAMLGAIAALVLIPEALQR